MRLLYEKEYGRKPECLNCGDMIELMLDNDDPSNPRAISTVCGTDRYCGGCEHFNQRGRDA